MITKPVHQLKVKDVKNETADTISISFRVPVELKENYTFKPGQYISLKINIEGKTIYRSYSLCNSPFIADEELRIIVKRTYGGEVSNFINDHLKAGTKVEVMEPAGNFFAALNEQNAAHYILFGGGSGISPLLSIIKSVLVTEHNSRVTLFYANRTQENIILKTELDVLSKQFTHKLKVVYVLDTPHEHWSGYSGLMNQEMVHKLLTENTDMNFDNAELFMCGPAAMIHEIEKAIHTLHIAPAKIHIESFAAAGK